MIPEFPAKEAAAEPATDAGTADLAGKALRLLAADPTMRAAFSGGGLLQSELSGPAERYVSIGDRSRVLPKLAALSDHGLAVTVENIGEDTQDAERAAAVVEEYRALIADLGRLGGSAQPRVGFDLSNIGLLIDAEVCHAAVDSLARAGAATDVGLIVSMERSALVAPILAAFRRLAPDHPKLGLTLQAHLHRTLDDVRTLPLASRPVRLVKGAYAEPPSVALPRGAALNRRYLDCLRALVDAGAIVSVATQDSAILNAAAAEGLLDCAAEVEMFYGVAAARAKDLQKKSIPVRILVVYGSMWFLYFLHRIAEHPPNVMDALADHADPGRIPGVSAYDPTKD